MDPHSIGRPDPDPGGLKRAKMKKKTQQKSIKSMKINKIGKKYLCWYFNLMTQ
jgi:hypothetical protein